MESIGQLLQKERERQGRTLDDIAVSTRINILYLQAIEENDPNAVPGGFFFRSFVRQYARELNLPDSFGQEQLEWLAREQENAEKEKLAVPPDRTYSVARIPMEGVAPQEETRKWVTGVVLLGTVLVICSVAYAFWERYRSMVAVSQTTAQQQTPAETKPVDTPSTPAATTPPVTTPAVETAPPVTETPKSTEAPKPEGVKVAVRAVEALWMEVAADGQVQMSGIVPGGETRDFEAKEKLRIKFGNAGVVVITHQGKEVAPFGPRGSVRTVEFFKDRVAPVVPPAPAQTPNRQSPPPQG